MNFYLNSDQFIEMNTSLIQIKMSPLGTCPSTNNDTQLEVTGNPKN